MLTQFKPTVKQWQQEMSLTHATLAKLNIPSNLVVLDSSYQHCYKRIHVSASDFLYC